MEISPWRSFIVIACLVSASKICARKVRASIVKSGIPRLIGPYHHTAGDHRFQNL
jgi:hypothetical protein